MTTHDEYPPTQAAAEYDADYPPTEATTPTTAAPGIDLAWSQDTTVIDHHPRTWRTAWSYAAILIGAAAAVTALVLGIARHGAHHLDNPAPPAPATAAPAPLPPAPAPTDPDVVFTQLTARGGLHMQSDHPAIGHMVCTFLNTHTPTEVVIMLRDQGQLSDGTYPTQVQAQLIVDSAITAYCPEGTR